MNILSLFHTSKQTPLTPNATLRAIIPYVFLAGRLTLLAGLGLLYLANITAVSSNTKNTNVILPIVQRPFVSKPHMLAAMALRNVGNFEKAKTEMRIADELTIRGAGKVLGASSDPKSILREWESEPATLTNAYEHWISVTKTYPDYRDGFIQAGVYAYKLGNLGDAQALLKKAQRLDGDDKHISEMLKKIAEE